MSSSIAIDNSIETMLRELEVDRAKALLLWYLQEEDTVERASRTVQTLLDEINRLDAATAYDTLTSLTVTDLVRFSVLNEFGEGFSRRKACEFLIAATVERLEIQKETMF